MYRTHQSDATIERYLLAARKAKALLLLDVQPGRGDFLSEAQRLQRWLLEPDVGLALDPEWHVGDGEVPGQSIGSVTAEQVNEVVGLRVEPRRQARPAAEALRHPPVHRRDDRRTRSASQRPRGLAMTMNVDGFGNPANKISKYKELHVLRAAGLPQRLQALLRGGHGPHDARRRARAAPRAGPRRLRVKRLLELELDGPAGHRRRARRRRSPRAAYSALASPSGSAVSSRMLRCPAATARRSSSCSSARP